MTGQVFLAAATGAIPTLSGPVGGGVRIAEAIFDSLPPELPVTLIVARERDSESPGPRSRVGLGLPVLRGLGDAALLHLSETAYARFSREFEARATEWILRRGRPGDWVLANDISEGPDFRRLAAAGLRVVPIFHVGVAEFFCKMYLRDQVSPERLCRWAKNLERGFGLWAIPPLLRLVFSKERHALESAALAIAPSEGLQCALVKIYGAALGGRVRVLPWDLATPRPEPRPKPQRRVFLTLSRISWEKGLDVLLDASSQVRTGDTPRETLPIVAIAGDAAYMGGQAYLEGLKRRARGLPLDVRFLGYVTGAEKARWLAEAEVFISASHYEAYGLTVEEALAAGCPVLSLDHHGARQLGDRVRIIPGLSREERVQGLAKALQGILDDGPPPPPRPLAARCESLGSRLWALLQSSASQTSFRSPR